ncbi:MAG: bifunctional acetaldehyde-CoA/alcohol dehydrogenase [Leptospiraceae bacterium]|nr:bifunctional acetaldehyde-CoA/alcohol dehydrogenase [Leptospiraceae bacterium]MCP5496957.1 bifunctional acetaldehyde-CoA/alcohol dehydrogenase [Leptospiraceae bacterium]
MSKETNGENQTNASVEEQKKVAREERNKYLDSLAEKSKEAAAIFLQYSQEEVDKITREVVRAGIAHAHELAIFAVQETEMGIVEDKIIKNMVSTEFVWDYIKREKTVGILQEHPKKNLIEVAEPHGVIFGLTPVTNPTSTVMFKCIMALKTRNTLIFSAHNRAEKCSVRAAQIMYEAAIKVGAPENVIQWIERTSLEDVDYLFHHPDVKLIDATGGTSMVKAAYSSGKPALGVGAGNTPVYIEKTGDLEMAIIDILTSKSFDNGVVCASESTLVADTEVYNTVIEKFRNYGAYICNEDESNRIVAKIFHRGMPKPSMIGKSPHYLAEKAGFSIPLKTKILITPIKGIGKDHPLSGEKLFPVLSIYEAKNTRDAINTCVDVNYFGGTGHTASIFSRNEQIIRDYANQINAGRIVVNSPASVGALGGVYNDLIPTFSFGCGTGGGNITMDNINVKHYLNIKKVAKRTTASMWFRIPNEIYFNEHSIEYLRTIQSNTTIIITTPGHVRRGKVELVKAQLPQVSVVHVYTDTPAEPPFSSVLRGVEMLNRYKPDTIIALGGGSVLDIAKAIRFFYEHPDFDHRELNIAFLDPRKRVVEFPPDKSQVKLIAVPTTSGTGSEVTPIAVITDDETHTKISMVDYSLVPDVAVIDPTFTVSSPEMITVDTGFDTLTHAIEAMVSVLSNDFTDGMALQAFISVFNHLEKCYKNPDDMDERQRLHNASTMAGMAISNAFVGVNHSLSHAVGATFGVSHGRANAIFLPYVIKYNASNPTKFTASPNVKTYRAGKKYAYMADMARLAEHVSTVEDKVMALIQAVKDLQRKCGVQSSFQEYGISEQEYIEKLPVMINIAMMDPSGRSNPRMPMIDEMKDILLEAYYGRA